MPNVVHQLANRPREWWNALYMRSRPLRIARKIPTYLKYYPPDDPFVLRMPGPHTDGYTDANPFKILRIPPDEIQACSRRPYVRWRNVGKVMAGDWDQDTTPFADASFYDGVEASFYRSLEAHFLDGVEWFDTPFIQQVVEGIGDDDEPWECASVGDVRRRCARMDRLYADIATNGYKSQRELLTADDEQANGQDPRRELVAFVKRRTILGRDEIAVDIGRDGSFLFYDSKNRLAIAKLLDLDEVPVRVVVRHREWQATRDRVRSPTDGIDDRTLAKHPDLQDIRERSPRPASS